MAELEIYAAASADSLGVVSLAAALLSGQPPAWLTPEPIAGSPLRIYKVR